MIDTKNSPKIPRLAQTLVMFCALVALGVGRAEAVMIKENRLLTIVDFQSTVLKPLALQAKVV